MRTLFIIGLLVLWSGSAEAKQARLAWQENSQVEDVVIVTRTLDGIVKAIALPANTRQWTDTNMRKNQRPCYTVSAGRQGISSTKSNQVCVRVR
jgi:hypothetical protein